MKIKSKYFLKVGNKCLIKALLLCPYREEAYLNVFDYNKVAFKCFSFYRWNLLRNKIIFVLIIFL